MRSCSSRFVGFALSLAILGAVVTCAPSAIAQSWLRCPNLRLFDREGGPDVPTGEMMRRLRALEGAGASKWSEEEKSACYKELADDYRDSGSYRAESLYHRAVELSPEHPRVLEAIARYYRTFRGSQGLFAESEAYYVRAERAIENALRDARDGGKADDMDLLELREEIIRGRIELHKREGLGLLIPSEPVERFEIHFGSQIDYGEFPVSYNGLVAEKRSMLANLVDFETRGILREPSALDQRHRLRIRFGRYPYLDVAWHDVSKTRAIANSWFPGRFDDIDADEVEIAIEDTFGAAPVGDVLWRLEFGRGRFYEEGQKKDDLIRVTGSTTLTRSFGRMKTDLKLIGSYTSVDPTDRTDDDDWIFAANLRILHYPEPATIERRTIELRGYEYTLGVVQHWREWGNPCGTADQKEETFFAGFKLTEVIRRTDVQFLPNFFRNKVKGHECRWDARVDADRKSSDLELNLILTHRIFDFVNDLRLHQAERLLGIAQWAFNVRLFEDISTQSFDDFESRGAVLSSFVELFSGPANRSTMILEAAYELRDYYHLDDTQHLFRVGLRLGF